MGNESIQNRLRELTGGKPIMRLPAAKLEAILPELERLLGEAAGRLTEVEGQVEGRAVDFLTQEDGLAKLASLREQLAPAQDQKRAYELALNGVRKALTVARAKERQAAIAGARSALETKLAEREEVAGEIQALLGQMIEKLRRMQALGVEAIAGARDQLSPQAVRGLRLTAGTAAGMRADQVQREINMHLCAAGIDVWTFNEMPTRGNLSLRALTHNWHLQVLADFELRYAADHPHGDQDAE